MRFDYVSYIKLLRILKKRNVYTFNDIKITSPIIESRHKPIGLYNLRTRETEPMEKLKNENVIGLSAIGNSDAFYQLCESQFIIVDKNISHVDHHVYDVDDINEVNDLCLKTVIKTIITTEKDAVKLEPLLKYFSADVDVYALKIEITLLDGEERLVERINNILHR